jgi:hypothetical protein
MHLQKEKINARQFVKALKVACDYFIAYDQISLIQNLGST